MPTAPVWMTQQEMCDAFNVFGCYIRKTIAAIYKNNEIVGRGNGAARQAGRQDSL